MDSKEPKPLRGLYKHVKISVRTLDLVIGAGMAILVIFVLWALKTGGYTVTFDARGGTDVAPQELRYGDTVAEPELPQREGYTFSGWCTEDGVLWSFQTDTVRGDVTLYAVWVPDS